MKKNRLFILPIFLLTLFSCVNNQTTKFKISYGTLLTDDLHGLTYEQLEYKMDHTKENFLLAIRPAGYTHCSCWAQFNPILKDYMKNTNTEIYYVDYYSLSGQSKTWNLPLVQNDPEFAFIENGTVKKAEIFNTSNPFFHKPNSFEEEVNSLTNKPSIYKINETIFSSLKEENKSFNVILKNDSLEESQYFSREIFNTINNNKQLLNTYVLDLNENEIDKDQSKLKAFSDKFEISNVNNTKYGYGNGYYPLIQNYYNGLLNDSSFIFNDKLANNESNFIISESFYSSTRLTNLHYLNEVKGNVLEGLEIQNDDVTNNKWKLDSAKKYYLPIVEAFTNKYLLNKSN